MKSPRSTLSLMAGAALLAGTTATTSIQAAEFDGVEINMR